jgi:small subunit ribosomal protein S20
MFRKAQAVAVSGGNLEDSSAAIRAAISSIDKAAEKGIIHRNNAARHKSRLMKKYNAAVAQAQAAAAETQETARPTRRRRTRET